MGNIHRIRAEILFTGGMIAVMVVLSLSHGLRITLPAGTSGWLFGAQVGLVLLMIGLWAGWSARLGRRPAMLRPIAGVLCYALVLVVHFNIKLWVPFVRPVTYDALFWQVDQFAYPIVRLCRRIDAALTVIGGADNQFYLGAPPVMLYVSLVHHGLKTPAILRKLFLSLLFMQGLGAIGYCLFPALGPFIYEVGANPALTGAQHNMFLAHQQAVAMGPHWLVDHGAATLFAGLGAMPSLHAASGYLFLWFAWRHGRILFPTYVPLFFFILVTAVGSRWHYLVDLPIGMLLAHGAIRLAHWCDGDAVPFAGRRLIGRPHRIASEGRSPSVDADPAGAAEPCLASA